MSDFATQPDDPAKMRVMKAEFTRLLQQRIQAISGDPRQARALVYELARIKLIEQSAGDGASASQILRALEVAIHEVERSFTKELAEAETFSDGSEGPYEDLGAEAAFPEEAATPSMQRITDLLRPKRPSAFALIAPLAYVGFASLGIAGAIIYWPDIQPRVTGMLSQLPWQTVPGPATTEPGEVKTIEQHAKAAPDPQAGAPAFPLPTSFGVYVLSDGELQELKALQGKVPDRRVAISAAIASSSQTSILSGDVKFIVFKPDLAVDTSGVEVRVVAKVARSMGVDSAGKATITAGDSWVIRSTSFPFKVSPLEDQSRMLLVQPENEGLVLTPGRYILVYKGIGYDFSVAGTVTDPNQCVERINAANGAFYSPCPPRR